MDALGATAPSVAETMPLVCGFVLLHHKHDLADIFWTMGAIFEQRLKQKPTATSQGETLLGHHYELKNLFSNSGSKRSSKPLPEEKHYASSILNFGSDF